MRRFGRTCKGLCAVAAMLFLLAGCAATDIGEATDASGSTQKIFTARVTEETRMSADPIVDERADLPFFTAGQTETTKPTSDTAKATQAPETTTDATTETSAGAQAVTPPAATVNYVCNTNSKKFHLPSCGSVKTIKAANRSDYSGTREELLAKGYSPCKKCEP